MQLQPSTSRAVTLAVTVALVATIAPAAASEGALDGAALVGISEGPLAIDGLALAWDVPTRTLTLGGELRAVWGDVAGASLVARVGQAVAEPVAIPSALAKGDAAPFDARVRLDAPGEHRVELVASAQGASGRVGALRQVFALVAADGAAELHVDHLPVTTPAAGPVAPATPAPSGAVPLAAARVAAALPEDAAPMWTLNDDPTTESHSTFVVTGCWFSQDESGSNSRPSENVWVQVWDDDSSSADDLLWEGLTALGTGCFTSAAIPRSEGAEGNQDVFAWFRMANSAVNVKTTAGTTYGWVSSTQTIGSQDTHNVGNIGPGVNGFASRIFDYTMVGWYMGVGTLGFPTSGGDALGTVQVKVPDALCDACYTRADDTIHLQVNGVVDRSPDDVAHEYGHYLQDKAYSDSFWPSPGGAHTLCEDGQVRGLSWTEGFADWFGPRANTVFVSSSDVSYQRPWDGSAFSIDMEAATACGTSAPGDDQELRVAWALWDLDDSADDGLDVGVSGAATRIRDVLRSCNSSNYRDFYDQGGCSWAAFGGSRNGFVRTAFQNLVDYNFAPSVSVTSQGSATWVRGAYAMTATASDPDTPIANVEFRASQGDNVCTTADSVVATDTTSPYSATLDTTLLTDGTSIWTCARGADAMEVGGFAVSGGPAKVDNTPPAATASGPVAALLTSYEIAWSASDATSGLVGTMELTWTSGTTGGTLCSVPVSGASASGTCAHDPAITGTICYTTSVRDAAGHTRASTPWCVVNV